MRPFAVNSRLETRPSRLIPKKSVGQYKNGGRNYVSREILSASRHTTSRQGEGKRSQASWGKEAGVCTNPPTTDNTRSHRYRVALKVEQKLADEPFPISVCHLPPGTSKWNKMSIDSFPLSLRLAWQAVYPSSHVELISATTTRTGLQVTVILMTTLCDARRVSEPMESTWHPIWNGEWNYTIIRTLILMQN